MIFLIDLPKKSPDAAEQPPTPFLRELQYFMKASNMSDRLVARLSEYDFNKTADIGFIHTM